MLLPKGSQSSLMGNVGLLQLSLKLGQLLLSLLIQFNLSGSVITCIFELLAEIFNIPRQEGARVGQA